MLHLLANPIFTAWATQLVAAALTILAAWWLQRRSLPPTPPSLQVSIYHIVHTAASGAGQPGQEPDPPRRQRFWAEFAAGLGWHDPDDWTRAGLLVAGALGAGAAYLQWRRPIMAVVGLVTIVLLAASVAPLVCLVARRVVATPGPIALTTVAVALSATGAANLYVLEHPVFRHGSFQEVLATADRGGIGAIIDRYDGPEIVLFAANQLAGIAAFIAMAFLLGTTLLFVLASVNIDIGACYQRGWRWLRRLTDGVGGFDTHGELATKLVATAVMAGLAYWFCSGRAYSMIGLGSGPVP